MNALERETTVNGSDGDEVVRITTYQRRHLSRLRKDDRFTEVKSGTFEGGEWATFTIPSDQWSPATGAKRQRKPLTEEQRAAVVAQLADAREQRGESAHG